MHIDTYDNTNTYLYQNIALAEIANEAACLFYLVGEADKKSEQFTEYLKTKIANNMIKHMTIDKKCHKYILPMKDCDFSYDPNKGIFRLGYSTLDAPIIKTEDEKLEQTLKTTVKTVKANTREKTRQLEFPSLSFNWGLHTQTSLEAGHPMTLFSKSVCDIKLADFLKADMEDRTIYKGLDPIEMIKTSILERLKVFLDTYTNVENINTLPYELQYIKNESYRQYDKSKKIYHPEGSKWLNSSLIDSLLKIDSTCVDKMYQNIVKLFSAPCNAYYNTIPDTLRIKDCDPCSHIHNINSDIKIDWISTIFDKKGQSILNRDINKEYQILFINNKKACDKLIEASKTANSYIETADPNMCLNMGIYKSNIVYINYGLTVEDLTSTYNHCIKKDDITVINGETITKEIREKLEHERFEYLADLYKKAIEQLPENTIEEFNRIMSKSKYAANMKLESIDVIIPKETKINAVYYNEISPTIQFQFKNVPTKEWIHGKNMCEFIECDEIDEMRIEHQYLKDPNDPVRQGIVNKLIEIYDQLYSIDNEFIRKTLIRMGLIKEGFIPEKY